MIRLNKILFVLIFLLVSCNEYIFFEPNLPEDSKNYKINNYIMLKWNLFKDFVNFPLIEEMEDSVELYKYNDLYYFFPNRYNVEKFKFTTKFINEEKERLFEPSTNHSLCIIHTKEKFISIYNVNIDEYDKLYLTDNFLCFKIVKCGNRDVYPHSDDIYTSGIILIHKNAPRMISLYKYPSEEIVSINETSNKKFRIITLKLKIVYTVLDRLCNEISNHFPIGYYRGFGEYYEYLYDSTLKQVSRKEL